MDKRDFIQILEKKFNELNGNFISSSNNYEKKLAEILGFSVVSKPYSDIEKDGFCVEVKKQQNAQWVDALKMSNIVIEKNNDILDSMILFLYYKKGEDFINTVALISYRNIIPLLGFDEHDFNLLYKLHNKKSQVKVSISKEKILKNAEAVLTQESIDEKFWSEHSVCQFCGSIYENTDTDMVCPDCEALTKKE